MSQPTPNGNLSSQDMEKMMSRYKQQLLQLQKAQRPISTIEEVPPIPQDVLEPMDNNTVQQPAPPLPLSNIPNPMREIADESMAKVEELVEEEMNIPPEEAFPQVHGEDVEKPLLAPQKDLLQIIAHYPNLSVPDQQILAYNLSCDLSRCSPIIVEGFLAYVLSISPELGQSIAQHLPSL